MTFSASSTIEATGVHHGYAVTPIVKAGRLQPAHNDYPELGWALIGAWSATVSKLSPGGFLLPHIDKGPYRDRFHVPISPAGWYWAPDTGPVRMADYRMYEIRHDQPHCVWNDQDRDRITLVVDIGPIRGDGPFQLFEDACPELREWLTLCSV